uniref:Uncharacterized protein n=1 Tax=Geladintestivirus 5 TaxID=3233137 RepID=A0AAU8MJ46_9CAUD
MCNIKSTIMMNLLLKIYKLFANVKENPYFCSITLVYSNKL